MRLWWLNPLQWNFGPRTTATLLTWAMGPLFVAGGVALWTIAGGAETGVLSPDQVQYLQVTLLRNAAIVTVPMLLVCIGAAVLFSSVVVRPLKALLEAMEQMAAGNLAQEPVPVRSRDEVGQATRAFNQMAESLQNMVRTVAGTAEELEGAGRRLQVCAGTTRSATEVSTIQIDQVRQTAASQADQAAGGARATEEMRAAAEQVASSADAQAKEVERVALTVRQVAQAIEQVAESAGVVADAAANTRLAADDGSRAVTNVVSGMDRVRDRVLNAAGQIEGLAQSLSHVDEILQLISEIADQTDLLALNAAIEAARVGEHGRGFAVVAGEVRRLAERSRRAAGDIADRISSLREGAQDVVVTMQAGTQEVHTGAELAREAGSSLDRILTAVTETQRQVESISAAAEEISAAGAQVVEVTHHLSAIAEENAATASQMLGSARSVSDMVATVEVGAQSNQASCGALAASSGKVRMTVEEMVACATQVSATSTKLREHVAQFRLK